MGNQLPTPTAANLGDQTPIRRKGHTKCIYHRNKEVIFVCRDCTDLICSTCSISTHRYHSLTELSDFVKEKKFALQEFINITERERLPLLEKEIQDKEKEQIENSVQIKAIVSEFRQQGEKLKHEIDIQVDQFTSLCNDVDRRNRDLLQTFRTEIQQQYDELVKECKQVLQTGTDIQVYDIDIPRIDDERSIPDLQTVEFCSCPSITDHIKKAMGTVTTSNDLIQLPRMRQDAQILDRPVVLSKVRHDSDVITLQPTPDGYCWFCSCYSDRIKLMSKTGKIKQEITNLCNVQNISLSPNTGHLWFCCMDDKTINEVLPTSKLPFTRFSTEGYPRSLCMTREDNVVVGTEDSVTVYTSDGKVLHTTSDNESGIGIPWNISQCPITGHIAVVSCHDGGNGHIIVYDSKLNMIFQYRGKGIKDVKPDEFGPLSICYDTRGQIVVADSIRNTIDLISGTGQYVRTLHTYNGKQGCIGIQNNNVLWAVLESDREIKLFKYYKD